MNWTKFPQMREGRSRRNVTAGMSAVQLFGRTSDISGKEGTHNRIIEVILCVGGVGRGKERLGSQ